MERIQKALEQAAQQRKAKREQSGLPQGRSAPDQGTASNGSGAEAEHGSTSVL